MDRSRWQKLIRIVDDDDICEWVNASSGTGSLRKSWTKGCKTIAVIVEW